MGAATAPKWVQGLVAGRVREFYAEIGVELPEGTGEAPVSCFAAPGTHRNEDRNKSASVNLVTGLWCCHGCGERGNAYRAATARGLLDLEAARLAKKYHLFIGDDPSGNFTMGGVRQWQKWVEALWAQPRLIERLGERKGWTPEAIRRLGVGWDGERLTFVVRRFKGGRDPIVGVVRYLPGGDPKTIAMAGSERTLFPMPEIMGPKTRPLFLVEGEPDVVAVRSAGHLGVGLPGAARWRPEWIQRLSLFRRVVFLGDCDAPGRELAAKIRATAPRIQVEDLDPQRDDGFDMGDLLLEAVQADGLKAGAWQVGRILDNLVQAA